MKKYTGLNPDCFMSLFNYLSPGDDCSNIKFYGTSKHLSEEKYANSEEVKSGPKPKISAKEQLFMYLSWLKNGFTLSHVSFLFQTPKSHVTYKGLISVSPSGSITFVSQLYDGSISDKEIVRKSGILEKELWSPGDSVMADRGFTIESDLKELNVDLNIPSFLGGRAQFTTAEVKESQTIASVRIHVERAIQRVKKFTVIRNEMPLTLLGSANQLWTVCCLLWNFLPPLIQT